MFSNYSTNLAKFLSLEIMKIVLLYSYLFFFRLRWCCPFSMYGPLAWIPGHLCGYGRTPKNCKAINTGKNCGIKDL